MTLRTFAGHAILPDAPLFFGMPDQFEDSIVGAPTPAPRMPHDFRLRMKYESVGPMTSSSFCEGFYCLRCGKRQNEAGEFCSGKKV